MFEHRYFVVINNLYLLVGQTNNIDEEPSEVHYQSVTMHFG